MRIQHVLAFSAAAILSLSVHAQQSEANPSAAGRVMVQGSNLPSVSRLTVHEAQFMKGTFALDNGGTFHLTNSGRKLYAEMDGKREELVQVGPQRFVGRDSGNKVSFDQVPFAYEVVIDMLRPDGSRVTLAGR